MIIAGAPSEMPKNLSASFRDGAQRRTWNPEASTNGVSGFRVRATQVGYRRSAHQWMPISGKPEMDGSPRNDHLRDFSAFC